MLEKIQFSATQGYEQSKSYLEYKILELIQRTDVVVTNSSLKEKIREEKASLPDSHEQLVRKEFIRGYLQSVESSTQSIRIRLFITDRYGLMMDGEHILPLSSADNALWYQKKGTQKVYFAPGIYLEEGHQEGYVALVRDIPEEDNYRRRNSVLRMDIGIEELVEILKNATPTENAATYLVNRENIIIAVSDSSTLEALGLSGELPEEFRYSRYAAESELEETKLDQRVIYCIRNKIRNTDWEMITVIPKTDMIKGIARLQYMVAGLMLLFGLLTIAGGTFIISWIVRRISRLNDSFNQVKAGDTKVYLPNDTRDEIGVLYDNYNDMMAHTNQLLDEKYRMGIHLKSAELKALQSQINPHFLYNTLDSIIWMAEGRKYEEVVLMTASLARLLRQSISNEDEVVPLAREVEYAKGYLTIQKMRYKDKLEFEIDVEPSILNIPLIKLVLQPIIENAIYHGLKYKESKGLLQVKGFMKDGNAVLQVIDNGVGMDEETLSHIYDKHKVNYHSNGVGVYNVQKRLKLYYGENYGITYESEKGVGTTATIIIPGIQEESI